jgi:hypothetical protein
MSLQVLISMDSFFNQNYRYEENVVLLEHFLTNKKLSITKQNFENFYFIKIFLQTRMTNNTLKSDPPCVYAKIS